jgi:hypothetical protein
MQHEPNAGRKRDFGRSKAAQARVRRALAAANKPGGATAEVIAEVKAAMAEQMEAAAELEAYFGKVRKEGN